MLEALERFAWKLRQGSDRPGLSHRVFCFLIVGFLTTLGAGPASAVTYQETDEQLISASIPAKVLEKLSSRQIEDMKLALKLMTMPAIPEELVRILTVASQLTRRDPDASVRMERLIAQSQEWADLGRSQPTDLQALLSLMYQVNVLPVINQLILIQGKTQGIDSLAKTSNGLAKTPFGAQALQVRNAYSDFIKQEKLKADANAAGAKDVLLVLSSPSADVAMARLNQSNSGTAKPACDAVTWLPAFDSEPGARYSAANGWEKPEVPCQ